MIFVTVGTSFPFDRLIKALDTFIEEGRIEGNFYGQRGIGGHQPTHFPSVETLGKKEFDRCFKQAEAIIAHAGMGTITMALELNKPLLVVPRLKEYNELVNNHQLATAKRFAQSGHILVAYHIDDLPEKCKSLISFRPVPRKNQAKQVADYIGRYLHTII